MESIVTGETLADIGRDLYPNATHPSQTVSNCLKQPTAQSEMAKIVTALDYTSDVAIQELNEAHERAKKKDRPDIEIQASMAKAKVAGLLVDKYEDVTQLDTDRLSDAAAKSLARYTHVTDETAENEHKTS